MPAFGISPVVNNHQRKSVSPDKTKKVSFDATVFQKSVPSPPSVRSPGSDAMSIDGDEEESPTHSTVEQQRAQTAMNQVPLAAYGKGESSSIWNNAEDEGPTFQNRPDVLFSPEFSASETPPEMFGKANSDNNGVFVFSGQAKPDANVGIGENSFDQNQGDANNSSNSNLFSGRKIDNNKGIFVFGAPENTFGSSNTAFRGENTIFTTKSSSPETKVFTFSGFNAQDSTKLDDNGKINEIYQDKGIMDLSRASNEKTTNQPVKPVPIAPSIFEFKGSEDSDNSTVQSNKLAPRRERSLRRTKGN